MGVLRGTLERLAERLLDRALLVPRSTPQTLGWPAGGLKTTMSPRSGSLKRKLTRSTRTRWPISSVGTIDSLGIRNGLTRKAWMPRAKPSATATIVTSSTSELCWRFFSLLPLATGASRGLS